MNPPRNVLMVDVGGSNLKLKVSEAGEVRKAPTGPDFTPAEMVEAIRQLAAGWNYDAISLGYPGLIEEGKPVREPLNLGGGWLEFDYRGELKRPVRMINDACLQALANYEGGRMLFMGFGTSIGAAFVTHGVLVPLELGLLRLSRRGRFMDRLSKEFLRREGKKRWRRYVNEAIPILQDVFRPTDIVLGGGNAKFIDPVPPACRVSSIHDAFRGAERLWPGFDMLAEPRGSTWHIQLDEPATHGKRKRS